MLDLAPGPAGESCSDTRRCDKQEPGDRLPGDGSDWVGGDVPEHVEILQRLGKIEQIAEGGDETAEADDGPTCSRREAR